MTTCPACGTSGQPDAARFCFTCGEALATPTCSSCGSEVVPGARFCSNCGAAQTEAAATAPIASRRVTSVLFGDLVGFTSLSETRDQEDVRELLSRYFDECRQVVARYGGTVEKFIGDAVMAVWGVPTAHEDDAERAVRAGLELVDAVAAIGEEIHVAGLAMRVGIVTGEVAVTIGAEQQGMVAGDAVNTAARVQSAATPGQVWVDETTRLLTSSAITYLDVGSHAMKGKADPVPLWAVGAVVAAVGGVQRADGLEAPHVGRDRELRLVKELFHRAEESGNPALVAIEADAGVGKTRLAWEFEKYTDGVTRGVFWHSGRCLSYGEGVAFYALAEAIRGRLRLVASGGAEPDADGPEDQVALLAGGLDVYVADPSERAWLEPRLGALLGIGTVGQFAREDLFSAWVTFLGRVGSDGSPVVLVIEDAQYADDGLTAFLEHLLTTASFACFVVMLTRPGMLEKRPSLLTGRRVTLLHLETLSDEHMGALLDGLVPSLPQAARESLIRRAEGVPLFAVETVRSLIDRDLVVPRGGQYVLADPDSLDMDALDAPASLHSLIAARLDTLTAGQRRVLDLASVLGQSFERGVLEALCADVPELDATLAALVRLQMLRQESSRWSAELGQYQFVQEVVRQVAYGSLSRRDRKAAHLAVVELLRDREEGADDLAPIIAGHLLTAIDSVPGAPDQAALTADAVDALRRAATRAASLGAPGEAAGHLEVALERATDPDVRRRVRLDLSEQLVRAGRYAEGGRLAEEARDAFLEAGDELNAARSVVILGWSLNNEATDYQRAHDVATAWCERVAHVPGAESVRLALHSLLVALAVRTGGDVMTPALEAVRLAALVGTQAEVADSYIGIGLAYQLSGLQGPGEVLMEAAVRYAREARDPRSLTRALMNSCVAQLGRDAREATELGREALQTSLVSGDRGWMSAAAANLVIALHGAGTWDEADVALEVHDGAGPFDVIGAAVRGEIADARDELVVEHEGSGDSSVAHYDQILRARVALREGRLEDAAALAVAAARQSFEVGGLFDDFTYIWTTAAEIARHCDVTVTRELLEVMELDTDHRPPRGCLAARSRELARLAQLDGAEPSVVEGHFRDAVATYEQWRAEPHLARCLMEYGAWLAGQGRGDESARALAQARETFERLRATRWLRELDEALGVPADELSQPSRSR